LTCAPTTGHTGCDSRKQPCSIIIGNGITSAGPGSVQGLHLIVIDIEAARAELAKLLA
jgi:hypothetical protein